MDLSMLRKRVDGVDAEILALLSKRMELTVRAKGLKEEIEDSEREKLLLDSIKTRTYGLLSSEFSQDVFKSIISESKRLQKSSGRLIGFQGEHGAYSEIASNLFNAEAFPIPHSAFVDVFEGVKSGALDMGIVPVENSLAGNVSAVDDLLISSGLHVIAELKLPIHYCLISLADTDYRDIRVVYSHRQTLSQCRGFISRNKLEAKPYYDTAGSALMLANEKPAATAVIASSLTADLYNLEVLKENIEDRDFNVTRFLVISKEPSKEAGNKCSIVFSADHKPGALLGVLSAFSNSGINLTRIESRPVIADPGTYAFLIDFSGSDKDTEVVKVLKEIEKNTSLLKVLGCYNDVSVKGT